MDNQTIINQEVLKRTAHIQRECSDRINAIEEERDSFKQVIAEQNVLISQLTGGARNFGTVVHFCSDINADKLKSNADIIVVDPASDFNGCTGRIASINHPQAVIELNNESKSILAYDIDTNSPKIKLIGENDGTYATVLIDGKLWEVTLPNFDIALGDQVKIDPNSKNIIEKGYRINAGAVVKVLQITKDGVEVEDQSGKKLIQNYLKLEIKVGSKVVTDGTLITSVLPEDDANLYKLTGEPKVTWDDVGLPHDVKMQFRQAIEWPRKYPDLFKFYSIGKEPGFLIYGPPGCGKTLSLRAVANSLAAIYGKEALTTGYIFVKGPELLDKWVGSSEAKIRGLFSQAREHARKNGYPAMLAIDEAEAIMPQRGTRLSSDVSDTIVPMFLEEMDGIDEAETALNPIVFLLTNRPDMMDQAVIRSGRINRHIKIGRPTMDATMEIFNIHCRNIPFAAGSDKNKMLLMATSDIFSKNKVMYQINGEHTFAFQDCLNGAIIKTIVTEATMKALQNDIENNKTVGSGITWEDLKHGIKKVYEEQKGLNHTYDLQDFAEKVGIQAKDMKVERCLSR